MHHFCDSAVIRTQDPQLSLPLYVTIAKQLTHIPHAIAFD